MAARARAGAGVRGTGVAYAGAKPGPEVPFRVPFVVPGLATGTAMFSNPLSVEEFVKRSSVICYTPEGLLSDAPATQRLAERVRARRRRRRS